MRRSAASQRLHFLSLLVLSFLFAAVLLAQSVPQEDTSDWWSIINPWFPYPEIKPRHKEIGADSFKIVGLNLVALEFDALGAKLGEADIVERGGGSIARSQVCYVSPSGSQAVHLVFELSEYQSTFYLFSEGPDWKGGRLCKGNKSVSVGLATASGLRLGLSHAEVESILGVPDLVVENRLIYDREVRRKTTPEEFKDLRQNYGVSEQQAHKEFDLYEGSVYIEARFAESRVKYLAVSMSRTAYGRAYE